MSGKDPQLGDLATSRICSRRLGYGAHGEIVCGKPPVAHVIWTEDVENGFVCQAHLDEVTGGVWSYVAFHAVGSCCGMPGAMWFAEENECRYVDGELPTVEPERTVAVACV